MMDRPWLTYVVRPLLVGGIIASFMMAVLTPLRAFLPDDWNMLYIVVIYILLTIEATFSYHRYRDRLEAKLKEESREENLTGSPIADLPNFRPAEFLIFLVLLRFGRYISVPFPDVIDELSRWSTAPLLIIDPEFLAAGALATVVWAVAVRTAYDLYRVTKWLVPSVGELTPMESLTRRFYSGGLLLIVLIGIVRMLSTRFQGGFDAPDLTLNLILYFLLGLALLTQVQLMSHQRTWRAGQVDITQPFIQRWMRHSVTLLAIAVLIALILPNGQSTGLFEILSFIIGIPWYILGLIPAPERSTGIGINAAPPTLSPEPTPAGTIPPPSEIAETITPVTDPTLIYLSIFWSVVGFVVLMIVISFLLDHPEIWQSLRRTRIGTILRNLWSWLRGLFRSTEFERARRERVEDDRIIVPAAPRLLRRVRPDRLSDRERLLYYYLQTIDDAEQVNIPRHPAQTPYEFSQTLKHWLNESGEEIDRLTEGFMQARYTKREATPKDSEQAESAWQRIKRALNNFRQRHTRPPDN